MSFGESNNFKTRLNRFNGLLDSYFRTFDEKALNEATRIYKELLEYPELKKHPELRAELAGKLGAAHGIFYERTGRFDALKSAIELFESGLRYVEEGSSDWVILRMNLGNAYLRYYERSRFDGCFKLFQSVLPTCSHKGEGRKNKTFSFSYSGLIVKPTHTRPEKEKFFENLTF